MGLVVDKNYYPLPFEGGSSLVSSQVSGANTIETHEFYNSDGKVVFYWKIKKDANGNLIDFRIKIPTKPSDPVSPYVDFDTLS